MTENATTKTTITPSEVRKGDMVTAVLWADHGWQYSNTTDDSGPGWEFGEGDRFLIKDAELVTVRRHAPQAQSETIAGIAMQRLDELADKADLIAVHGENRYVNGTYVPFASEVMHEMRSAIRALQASSS